ncbi:MAG: nucleotidyltransferase family protein [Armatimonadetes bacterium]|nr:nucleotidyltransferase family protein [Armatimonadota bacterium]
MGQVTGCPPTLEQVRAKRDEILRLAAHYDAHNVRLFGSVARGDEAEGSDLDFLVDAGTDCSLFDLGGLLMDLQELLGCEVDVVSAGGLRDRIRERVLGEAVPL